MARVQLAEYGQAGGQVAARVVHERAGQTPGHARIGDAEAGADSREDALDGLGQRQARGHGADQRIVGFVEDRVELRRVGGQPGCAVEPPGALLPRDAGGVQGTAEVEENGGCPVGYGFGLHFKFGSRAALVWSSRRTDVVTGASWMGCGPVSVSLAIRIIASQKASSVSFDSVSVGSIISASST